LSTIAELSIEPHPEMGDEAKRFTVDCPCCTTCVFWSPEEALGLTERDAVLVTFQRHEARCGRCNLVQLWQRYVNRGLQEMIERTWQQSGPHDTVDLRN
jgi:hypothetical protein